MKLVALRTQILPKVDRVSVAIIVLAFAMALAGIIVSDPSAALLKMFSGLLLFGAVAGISAYLIDAETVVKIDEVRRRAAEDPTRDTATEGHVLLFREDRILRDPVNDPYHASRER